MKVTNWRRKLMASLVAGGLLAPGVAVAADLDTNLAVDPSFENTDPNDTGPFASHRLLSWPDSNLDGNSTDDNFAFQFSQNYAGVNTPAGSGTYYFSGGFGTTAGQATLAQSVSVDSGATGTLIPTGEAAFHISGFFSGYLTQADASKFRVRFLNASDVELGRAEVGGFDFVQTQPLQPGTFGQHRNWGQDSLAGLIPAGTTDVAVEVVADISAGNHDGYVDLVDFRVVNAADFLLYLEVNTTNGQVRVRNQTGEAVNIDYYEITSAGNALNATAWNSLQEQNLAGFPAGNGSGNGWEEAGGSSSTVVSESYLTDNSAVANNSMIGLGAAFNVAGAHDLEFKYGALAANSANPTGDYNDDGIVNAADYVVWRNGGPLANDTTPGVQPEDYDVWRANFGLSGGPSGPGTLTTGFVRYVTSFSGAGAGSVVPEPSTVILVGLGLSTLMVGGRRRSF